MSQTMTAQYKTYFQFCFNSAGKLINPQKIQLPRDVDTLARDSCLREIREFATFIPLPDETDKVFFGKYNGDGWLFSIDEVKARQ